MYLYYDRTERGLFTHSCSFPPWPKSHWNLARGYLNSAFWQVFFFFLSSSSFPFSIHQATQSIMSSIWARHPVARPLIGLHTRQSPTLFAAKLPSIRTTLVQQPSFVPRQYATARPTKKGGNKNPYSDTILLPKTEFSLRADAVNREHLFRDRCTKDLYPWQVIHDLSLFWLVILILLMAFNS